MDIISFNEAATANSRIEIYNANPDSTSGIVTVPKIIASGETITIPAGRVAILPNVQIDGILNVKGEVFIPSGATLGDLDADKMDKDINGLVTKTTPVNADEMVIADSTSSFSLKKLSFSNLRDWLKTLFIQKDYVIISGSATFSPTNNTIVLTGIGSLGLKIGDVIRITNSTGNNKTFNVEHIFGDGSGLVTDLNTIIVNYEHRGISTPVPSKRLIAETSTVSITLVTNPKEFEGLGWCNPASGRVAGVTYTNSIGKTSVSIIEPQGGSNITINISSFPLTSLLQGATSYRVPISFTITDGNTYSFSTGINQVIELR